MAESFRDRSVLINKEGGRVWMYPKKIKGFYHRNRLILGFFLLAIFFITPFLKVHGEPFFLFNILDRKFILFGVIFWPQDAYLFFLAMISLMIFIILFTVTYGRLWCGWTCPQTILMELVFRKIEYFIEGSAAKQRELRKQPASFKKFAIKFTKHFVFIVVSFLIAESLISYFVSQHRMFEMFGNVFAEQNRTLFLTTLILSAVIYFIYSQVRELVCTIICPYGRLQGALVDEHTVVVAYDFLRGEPKGHANDENSGDCIDCKQCVAVCPTGIDIRNGTQLECVNCTACIDACDSVMTKIKKPKGLIRYASLDQIRNKKKFKLSTRGYAYSFVLVLLLLSFFVYLFSTRSPIEASILRTPGLLYQEQDSGQISNLYNIKVVNKSRDTYHLVVKLLSHEGKIVLIGEELIVKPSSSSQGVFFVYLPKKSLTDKKLKLQFGVFQGSRQLDIKTATFIGP